MEGQLVKVGEVCDSAGRVGSVGVGAVGGVFGGIKGRGIEKVSDAVADDVDLAVAIDVGVDVRSVAAPADGHVPLVRLAVDGQMRGPGIGAEAGAAGGHRDGHGVGVAAAGVVE